MKPQEIIEHFKQEFTDKEPKEAVSEAIEFVKDNGFEHSFYTPGLFDKVWEHSFMKDHNDNQPTVMTKGFFTLYKSERDGKINRLKFVVGRVGNSTTYVKRF